MISIVCEDPRHLWVTADLHLAPDGGRYGEETIRRSGRPFRDCADERSSLSGSIGRLVGEQDTLVVLGDLVSRDVTDDDMEDVIRGIPRHDTWLVVGNHDVGVSVGKWESVFGTGHVCDYLQIVVPCMENDSHDGTPLRVLCFHYPMMAWDGERFGNAHLHGHTHYRVEYNDRQREMGIPRYDVGVDANGFAPIRLSDVLDRMEICG